MELARASRDRLDVHGVLRIPFGRCVIFVSEQTFCEEFNYLNKPDTKNPLPFHRQRVFRIEEVDHGTKTMLWTIAKEAAGNWSSHKDSRQGAALAYYSVFRLAPLSSLRLPWPVIFFGRDAVTVR